MGRRKKHEGPGVDISTMTAICESCGAIMDRHDEDTFICPDCGCSYYYDDNFGSWEFYDPMEEGWHEDTMSRPKVCTGCGSDMYPDCQYSCKLMNN